MPAEFLSLAGKMVGLRNIIVHSYDRIDDSVIYGILRKNLIDIERLKNHLIDSIKKTKKLRKS